MKRFHRHWTRDLAVVAAAAFVTLAAMVSGFDKLLEHAIEPVRIAMLRHDASGRVAVGEMDAASPTAAFPMLKNTRRAAATA